MSTDTALSQEHHRGAFPSRNVFILAAIGSAVGLGNIWRFPYVAYKNGGGAFILPYLVALLVAGIAFLWLDYSMGHKYRGSAPLSFARAGRRTEGLGWWQVGICFIIAIYYAAVLAWAGKYTIYSFTKAWGAEPGDFLFETVLRAGDPGVTMDFVPGIVLALAIVWVVIAVIMSMGVQKGIGATSVVFIPLLIVVFLALVVQALLLPGAAEGLNALFTPKWSALADASVWAAAFGQIFFSLSIGFGIMITYASYVGKRTDMTSSGLVVGFANSAFELLAGIGVFAALGFMAQASGTPVDEVVDSGLGLAFVAFPAIINEAPAGSLLGVLFFASLVMAGLTSLISVLEVVISAVRDKFEMKRLTATLSVVLPTGVISMVLFSTTSGVFVLDIMDHFVNRFGILLVAVISMIVLSWGMSKLPALADHMNMTGAIKLGKLWQIMISIVAPAALTYVLVLEFIAVVKEPYEGYPGWMLGILGWGMAAVIAIGGFLVARVPWRPGTSLTIGSEDDEKEEVRS